MEKQEKKETDCFDYWAKVSRMKLNSIKCKIMTFEARIRASAVNWELKPENNGRRK